MDRRTPPLVKQHISMASDRLSERYRAAMVLSGVGDALGYKNGSWEFCGSGKTIHDELRQLGGLQKLKVCLPDWRISDDTVMHLATGDALVTSSGEENMETLFAAIAQNYIACLKDMGGRAPGATCMSGARMLQPLAEKGYQIPYNKSGGGCGAAMRSMCIGLRYARPEDVDDLIAVSVESGRMTHHHPTGYLGSLASALFTAYAIQGKPPREWGYGLMSILPKALKYVKSTGHCVRENECDWSYFTTQWEKYLAKREITSGKTEPKFPKNYDVDARDEFYRSVSYGGWGGANGHDAPMIAYDTILSAGKDWDELCSRAMFHCGDSDSTGVIAACCYGAMYGFHGVHKCNYEVCTKHNCSSTRPIGMIIFSVVGEQPVVVVVVVVVIVVGAKVYSGGGTSHIFVFIYIYGPVQ
ncbi:protein ADP-ribosylarginine hydrolase-like isoform X1 [Gigantopelta aegis]|uniref:protein ADP-ribosylarginine hydrolase-like isoform X1 n=2 Tax=Gigantopelta aegis TaxID=1735272 RepID=UPI001B88A61C|nr:protein ADP-ribosylarginine hydrolase-like isoform X1 [Gigantopelta aegis]